MKLAFTLFLVALMILPAVAIAGYRFRRALRERDARDRERQTPES